MWSSAPQGISVPLIHIPIGWQRRQDLMGVPGRRTLHIPDSNDTGKYNMPAHARQTNAITQWVLPSTRPDKR